MEAEMEKNDRRAEKRKRTPFTASAADDEYAGELGSIMMRISDESVLECLVCSEALEAPVYQCFNGHVICSTCRNRVKQKKCPTCPNKVGNSRCRAIEAVLEAVKVHCPYKGCPVELSYSSKRSHEESCAYAPFGCPFDECNFTAGGQKRLSLHLNNSHARFLVHLRFDQVCSFSMSRAEEFVVFHEEANGTLFVLHKFDKMAVSCIGGSAEDCFAYALVVRGKDSSLRFQSFTIQYQDTFVPSEEFIEVPSCMFGYDGCLKLELCIWRKGEPSVDIAKGSLGEEAQ